MDRAFDHTTGSLVLAREFVGRHGLNCPVCRKQVYWRRGWHRGSQYVPPSFCHKPGEGDENCENFHPGQNFAGAPASAVEFPPPTLYVSPKELTQKVADWTLDLSIPAAPDETGRVIVEQSMYGVRTIPATKLLASRYLVPVKPDCEGFRLKSDGLGNSAYEASVCAAVPGLDIDIVNVFLFSESGGARIPSGAPLLSGKRYFFVWNQRLSLQLPVEIKSQSLKDKSNWKCQIVEFPAELSEVTRRWAIRFLAREVQERAPGLSFVAPLERVIVDSEFYLVRRGDLIVVAVVGAQGVTKPSVVAVTTAGSRYSKNIDVTGELPFLISIPTDELGLIRVHLPEFEQVSLSVGVRAVLDPPEPLPVLLISENSSQIERVTSVHSSEAKTTTALLADGVESLLRIQIPPGVRAAVRVKTRGSATWAEIATPNEISENMDETDRHTAYEDWVTSQVVGFIKTPSLEWEIDFQNFGRIRRTRSKNLVALVGLKRLPPELKARLSWVVSWADGRLSLDRAVKSVSALRIREQFEDGDLVEFPAADQALARAAAYRSEWPLKAEPYLAAVADQLALLLRRSRRKS